MDPATNGTTREKRLFTPGPLNTRPEVRQAMLRDLGSRDSEFIDTVRFIRTGLLQLAGVSADTFTVVPVQGSGTYALEAMLQTASPRDSARVLVLCNGAYGRRMVQVCQTAGVACDVISQPEDRRFDLTPVERQLQEQRYSAVTLVHCETSSGVLNPVLQLGRLISSLQPSAAYLLDSMSAFGAVPVDLEAARVDFLVSSANKCIEGVPGFAFCIARLERLRQTKGNSRSLSLDLYDQWAGLEKTGQFRFTPPTHTMLAFARALKDLLAAGGVEHQAKRYKTNNAIVKQGLRELGFRQLVQEEHDAYIITSFLCPADERFSFHDFYRRLADLGQVIYPGKVTDADCFRVGNIGDLHPEDMHHLVACVKTVLSDMGVETPVQYK